MDESCEIWLFSKPKLLTEKAWYMYTLFFYIMGSLVDIMEEQNPVTMHQTPYDKILADIGF